MTESPSPPQPPSTPSSTDPEEPTTQRRPHVHGNSAPGKRASSVPTWIATASRRNPTSSTFNRPSIPTAMCNTPITDEPHTRSRSASDILCISPLGNFSSVPTSTPPPEFSARSSAQIPSPSIPSPPRAFAFFQSQRRIRRASTTTACFIFNLNITPRLNSQLHPPRRPRRSLHPKPASSRLTHRPDRRPRCRSSPLAGSHRIPSLPAAPQTDSAPMSTPQTRRHTPFLPRLSVLVHGRGVRERQMRSRPAPAKTRTASPPTPSPAPFNMIHKPASPSTRPSPRHHGHSHPRTVQTSPISTIAPTPRHHKHREHRRKMRRCRRTASPKYKMQSAPRPTHPPPATPTDRTHRHPRRSSSTFARRNRAERHPPHRTRHTAPIAWQPNLRRRARNWDPDQPHPPARAGRFTDDNAPRFCSPTPVHGDFATQASVARRPIVPPKSQRLQKGDASSAAPCATAAAPTRQCPQQPRQRSETRPQSQPPVPRKTSPPRTAPHTPSSAAAHPRLPVAPANTIPATSKSCNPSNPPRNRDSCAISPSRDHLGARPARTIAPASVPPRHRRQSDQRPPPSRSDRDDKPRRLPRRIRDSNAFTCHQHTFF